MKRKVKLVDCLRSVLVASFLVVSFYACIDQIEFETSPQNRVFVIEGVFSNLEEMQVVRVSQSISLGSQVNEPVYDAQLFVEDGDGNRLELLSQNDGSYATMGQALPGKEYRLAGTLPGGLQITSNFQTVPTSVEVDEINLVDTLVTFLDENGKTTRWRALDFYANATLGPFTEKKYLRFSTNTVYQTSEITCSPFHTAKICYFYDDNPPSEVQLFTIDTGESPRSINSLVYRRQIDYTLGEIFSLDLHLFNYNAAEYEYWENLKSLFDQDGGITDVLPGRLKGNITAANGTEVQGQFAVVGKSRKIKFVRNSDFSTQQLPLCGLPGFRPQPLPGACCSCDGSSPSARLDKPDYWP